MNLSENEKRIYDCLNNKRSFEDILNETNLNKRAIRYSLKKLRLKNLIREDYNLFDLRRKLYVRVE